ncbi:MAG: glycosyltransferase family 4 protein [Candidatus Latescibacterota bacterium]
MSEILFIKTTNSSFVRKDEEFLKRNYATKVFHFKYGAFLRVFLSEIQLTLWVFRHIWHSKLLFIWFADYHSLIPILVAGVLGRKSVLVVGGYDVANMPELRYGVFVRKFRGLCAGCSLRNASFVLPVAESLIQDIYENVGDVKGTIEVIQTGYDYEKWKPNEPKTANQVLTVAIVDSHQRCRIKGIDLFIEIAKRMPDMEFVLVGVNDNGRDLIEKISIDNLVVVGRIQQDELLRYYQTARIYAQLSLREGLPNVLCEAMLCECVPVGSDIASIADVIGDTGIILKSREVDEGVNAIQEALKSDGGKLARHRIMRMFPQRKRDEALKELMDSLLV